MAATPRRLVGREAVLRELRREAEGARLVVVRGAAGSGLTAVLDALAATHDGPVRRARGAAWESDRPGGVVAQLLGDAVGEPTDAFAVAEALVAALGDGGPTVLAVDDAHVADAESLRALDTLVAHHPSVPLRVVLAARIGGAGPEVDTLLRRVPDAVDIEPLTRADVAELAAARGRPLPELAAERLRRHTGGVVRDVVAVLDEVPAEHWADAHLRLPAPSVVVSRVRDALAGCGPETRALVEAVAVLGAPAELHEVAALADTSDVLAPLDEAARAGLVSRARGSAVSTPDPMVRAAVLDHMGPDRAARTRLRAAEVVEDPVRALRLRAAATPGRDPVLADRIGERADRAAADGAWSAVAALLADAARLTADRDLRDDRRTRSVDAQVGAGEVLDARAMMPEVAGQRETPRQGAVLGYLAINLGLEDGAGSRLARAWSQVDPQSDPEQAALVAQRHVLHALARCRGEDLLTWTDRVSALAEPGSPAAIEAAAIRGLGLAVAGRPGEAVGEYRRVAASVPHGAQVQRVTMGRGWLGVVTDDVDGSRLTLESATATTALGGSARISLWALGWLARARFLCGEWDRALSAVDRGRALAERTGIVLATPLLEWTAAQVHVLRDEPDRAEDALRRSESGPLDYAVMRVPALLARAQVAEVGGDWERVLRVLAPLAGEPDPGVDEPGWWPWTDVHAGALVMTGRLDEADAFLRPHETCAAERGHRSTLARLGCARGRWHGAHGEADAAREAFETALAQLDGLPLRYDRARIEFAFGQTLRRAGKRRDADAVLVAARDRFAALGASAHVARCERELRAGGVHPERGASTGNLTPQERAVTGLVARGLSNREVAAELHVSPKTVQYHLTRVYAKLGVRSRSELAALGDPASPRSLASN